MGWSDFFTGNSRTAKYNKLIGPAVAELLKRGQERLPADAFARDWLFAATCEADCFLSCWLLDEWKPELNSFAGRAGSLKQVDVVELLQTLTAIRLAFFLLDDDAREFVERVAISAENFLDTVIGVTEMPDSVVMFFNTIAEILADETSDQSTRMYRVMKRVLLEMARIANVGIDDDHVQQVFALASVHDKISSEFGKVLTQRMDARK